MFVESNQINIEVLKKLYMLSKDEYFTLLFTLGNEEE